MLSRFFSLCVLTAITSFSVSQTSCFNTAEAKVVADVVEWTIVANVLPIN